jgi:iron-sulfur cluster assembly protein
MLNLSQAAASEIKRLRSKHQKQNAMFRLGVQPGGCAGMIYKLEFDQIVNPEDRVWERNGLQVVVSAQSLNYINGLTIDLMGGGFRFHNPNATQSCGCGNSFSIPS